MFVDTELIDGGLWTLIVYLVDGDVNKITSTFTNGQVDDGHFDTIGARIRAIDVLRTIFTTRHAEIKQLDEATKKSNVNKFTLANLKNLRASYLDIIFKWLNKLTNERSLLRKFQKA